MSEEREKLQDEVIGIVEQAIFETGTGLEAALVASERLLPKLAVVWAQGYYRGCVDTEGDLEPADNPYEEEE